MEKALVVLNPSSGAAGGGSKEDAIKNALTKLN
jgi:hypothetical protein